MVATTLSLAAVRGPRPVASRAAAPVVGAVSAVSLQGTCAARMPLPVVMGGSHERRTGARCRRLPTKVGVISAREWRLHASSAGECDRAEPTSPRALPGARGGGRKKRDPCGWLIGGERSALTLLKT